MFSLAVSLFPAPLPPLLPANDIHEGLFTFGGSEDVSQRHAAGPGRLLRVAPAPVGLRNVAADLRQNQVLYLILPSLFFLLAPSQPGSNSPKPQCLPTGWPGC